MTREERQKEASDSFEGNERSMIIAAPRFGKIKVTVDILNRIKPEKVLICFPRVDIQQGWDSDFEKWGYKGDVTYTTFRSLGKKIGKAWDFIVVDEIHEASNKQLEQIALFKTPNLLGLSGTVTRSTENNIYRLTGITPCYEYTINQAVEEGILCDYNIIIHKVDLDDTQKFKGKTEKKRFDDLLFVSEKLKKEKKDTFFIYLKQIQLIQGSLAKRKETKRLLELWSNDRILVFCGTTEVADWLPGTVYHSKKRELDTFNSFCEGKDGVHNHLITIKMAQAGVTVKPIQKGLINYTSGNPEDCAQKICRFLGWEYDNPGKKAEIHLVISTEKFEEDRIKTALSFFDNNKIKGL